MESGRTLTEAIGALDREQSEYLDSFFANCPEEVLQTAQHVTVPKGQAVMQAGAACEYVWIVIKGEVSVEDIRMPGNVYSFSVGSGIHIVGDYEPFAGLAEYQKTVCAETTCEIFRIPSAAYMRWMRQDGNALFMRTHVFARTLAQEISSERQYLLLNSRERLILYLVKAYGKWENGGECIIRKTQAELAQRIGVNVRTVQRSIHWLQEMGFVSCHGGKIHIMRKQYEMLEEYRNANLK